MRIACWLTPVAVAIGLIVAGVPTASAGATDPPAAMVASWVAHHATPLATVDPAAALDDLAPLGRSVGGARIVGSGESAHGAAEELELKLRVLRFLVEERGFRSVAWEEDWATGQRIDRYIRGGAGDADQLVGQMLAQWHSPRVADVLRWLRAYNTGRSDKVRFVGVEYYLTGQPAYDAVAAYVAARAPERLAELRALQPVRGRCPRIPRRQGGRQPAMVAGLLRRQDRLLGGEPAHGECARPAHRRPARAGHALPVRGLLPAALVRAAVSVHRVHLRPRRTATRARANGSRAAGPAGMVRATARLGRIWPVRRRSSAARSGSGAPVAGRTDRHPRPAGRWPGR